MHLDFGHMGLYSAEIWTKGKHPKSELGFQTFTVLKEYYAQRWTFSGFKFNNSGGKQSTFQAPKNWLKLNPILFFK